MKKITGFLGAALISAFALQNLSAEVTLSGKDVKAQTFATIQEALTQSVQTQVLTKSRFQRVLTRKSFTTTVLLTSLFRVILAQNTARTFL